VTVIPLKKCSDTYVSTLDRLKHSQAVHYEGGLKSSRPNKEKTNL